MGQGNGLQSVLYSRSDAHPLMSVQEQGAQIEQFFAGQPDRWKTLLSAALESTPHRADHASASSVLRHESLQDGRPDIRSPVRPSSFETTASIRRLRCPPTPGAEAENRTLVLRCLRASPSDSLLLPFPCPTSPTIAGDCANHIL